MVKLKGELLWVQHLDPSNFPSMEDYLSIFKTLKLLLEGCKITKEEEPLIYDILAKLPSTYSDFVSTFYSTRETLISVGTKYRAPSLDTFCDSLVREQERLLHLRLVKTGNSSNKALVSQQSQGFKNQKKQYPKRNGPKPNNCNTHFLIIIKFLVSKQNNSK